MWDAESSMSILKEKVLSEVKENCSKLKCSHRSAQIQSNSHKGALPPYFESKKDNVLKSLTLNTNENSN